MKPPLFIFFIVCLLFTGSAWGQESVLFRDFSIQIVNKRSKPISGIVVQAITRGDVGITDKSGKYLFKGVENDEIIRMFLPGQGECDVPVAGLDSLQVIVLKNQVNFHNPYSDELINVGYGTMSKKHNSLPVSSLDAEKIVAESSAKDLFDLIRGRVAGVDIGPDNSVRIRGVSSINSSTEPLVVVDGSPVGSLAQVNQYLNVNDVKNISVLKDGAGYGVRGANGVILITTKTGKE